MRKRISLKKIDLWFSKRQRSLPWRDNPSPYRVWLSEIMLQQTQVVTVIPYFERFIKALPTVEALAKAPESQVVKLWEGLGYYSRARNIHKAAKYVVNERGGEFPSDRDGWLEMSGVGPYTAGAILSIAYNKPEALVDGNVERVFARHWGYQRAVLGEAEFKNRSWEIAREQMAEVSRLKLQPSQINQAWMELGALVCTPKNPKCELCPIAESCAVFGKEPELYPGKKPRAAFVEVRESRVAIFDLKSKKVLLKQSVKGEWRQGLWDFVEKTDIRGDELGIVDSKHTVTNHKIKRKTRVLTLNKKIKNPAGTEWVDWKSPDVALSAATKKVLGLIHERYFE